MSTAPKLTYAKIGNKSKNKIESASSQLSRTQQQKDGDLFSHMNQDNLNYIKKQLKMKKNRSDKEPSQNTMVEDKQEDDPIQDQITQRDKLYNKYRGDESVSEKQPHLQETERRSSQQKALDLNMPQDSQQEYQETIERNSKNEKKNISTSQNTAEYMRQPRKESEDNKMYHSSPYEEPKKRVVSIEGYFGEAMSTNLNNLKDGSNFMYFLDEYISDLNHSKHLASKQHEEIYIDKKKEENKGRGDRQSRKTSQNKKQYSDTEQKLKQQLRKLQRLKRNSDTFGEPNSKYTINSNSSYSHKQQLELQLKQQKMNCIQLAQQMQKLRKLLAVKDNIIDKLQTNNLLLGQQVSHLRKNEQILRNKKQIDKHYPPEPSQKQTRRMNDQNIMYDFDNYQQIMANNRYGSVNPASIRTGHTYRGSSHRLRYQQIAEQKQSELFQQFAPTVKVRNSRQKTPKKNDPSLERLEQEYKDFLLQSKRSYNMRSSPNKSKKVYG